MLSFLVDMLNTLVEKLSKIDATKYQKKIPSLAEVGAVQSYS